MAREVENTTIISDDLSDPIASTGNEDVPGEKHSVSTLDPSQKPENEQSATFSSCSNKQVPFQSRPNTELTTEEKEAKRRGKRHLKQRTRIRKFELRWSQATGRQDLMVAERARGELREYLTALRDEAQSLWHQPDFPQAYRDFLLDDKGTVPVPTIFGSPGGNAPYSSKNIPLEPETLIRGRRWITREIWQNLVLKIVPRGGMPESLAQRENVDRENRLEHPVVYSSNNGKSRKRKQTQQARDLLQHMTKGTQTESMFDDDIALIGYTRQKFMERSLLAMKSLERLQTFTSQKSLWKRLIQRTRTVLSIGCGPGCDAVGVLTFLKQQRESDGRPLLDRIVLMDFVMPRWKRLVLDHLIPIIMNASSCASGSGISPGPVSLVSRFDTASCDVRYSLKRDERNQEAWECLRIKDQNNAVLIVVSYLLTETRDQWTDFFRDLLQEYAGCLLLLSEPTAWQLHSFITYFADIIEGFLWLDSSRDSPSLQALEGRLGPAVLLVHTKNTRT